MCLSPIPIKDTKTAGLKIKAGKMSTTLNLDKYGIHKSEYMWVPCGHCKQCIDIAQMEMVQRIQMEALNKAIYMATFTYNNEMMPYAITSQGWEYRYADHKEASRMLKRLRDNNTFGIPFSYILVSERGSQRARPHFHALLLFKNSDIGNSRLDKLNFEYEHKWTLFNEWKRKISGEKSNAVYKLCSTYVESWRGRRKHATYDFHWVDPWKTEGGITDAAYYVLKYMLKNSTHEEKIRQALKINYDNLPEPWQKTYWWEEDTEDLKTEGEKFWDLIRSRKEYSKGFGLGADFTKSRGNCCEKEDKNCSKCRKITEEICDQDIISYLRECIETSKKSRTEYAYYFCPERVNTFPLANYYKRYGFIYTPEDEDFFYNIAPERYRDRYLMPKRLTSDQLMKQMAQFEKIVKMQEFEDIADDLDSLFENG